VEGGERFLIVYAQEASLDEKKLDEKKGLN
jgi:hypothetical protein